MALFLTHTTQKPPESNHLLFGNKKEEIVCIFFFPQHRENTVFMKRQGLQPGNLGRLQNVPRGRKGSRIKAGGQFSLCPYSRRNTGGSRRGYLRISGRASCQEKKQICVRTSPETQQLVKEMCPLDSCRLLFKLAVELDMVMNALAAGMEIPDEQLRTLRSRCIQDVKNRRQYLAG